MVRSGDQDKFVPEGFGNRAPGFEQGFQMNLGRFLEPQNGFAAVITVSVAARKQGTLRDPNAVFVGAHLNLAKWNDHAPTVSGVAPETSEVTEPTSPAPRRAAP
jgi:hypothetical protein